MSYLRHIKKLWPNTSLAPGELDDLHLDRPTPVAFDPKARHPYLDLPKHTFWSRSHRGVPRNEIDPVVAGGFELKKRDKIATAGSCFAQNIARHLQERGYNYLVTEQVHPIISDSVARDFGYGVFTARYGNIYTARQLLQLTQRAYGAFQPVEDCWQARDGFLDPFRPNIQPVPFATLDEFYQQREIHFAAFRNMLEQANVFVFTFGMTEAWMHREDGAVFPLAPGVAGGVFDPAVHAFHNFTVSETVADFMEFVARFRSVNPSVKILMTVSPIPLAATARPDQSVIAASSYSKAVLRVAVEELTQKIQNCFYFPSYEIVTGHHADETYFKDDLRQVRRSGVEHVMKLFMRHFTTHGIDMPKRHDAAELYPGGPDALEGALDVICEEALLDPDAAQNDVQAGERSAL